MTHRFSWLGLAAVCLFACDQNKSGSTQTTGATQNTPPQEQPQRYGQPGYEQPPGATNGVANAKDQLVDQITQARCARERACNNVGAGKKWSDDMACRNDMRSSVHADFRTECRTVQNDKLRSCLDAIRDQRCEEVSGTVHQLDPCHEDNLCK